MKKLFSNLKLLCLMALALVATCCFSSCGGKGQGEVLHQEEKMIVISVLEAEEGATLKSVIDAMVEEGDFTYEEDGSGLITTINGYTATGSEYWGLYASDNDYANTEWGTADYNGTTYGSAMFGYTTLPVVEGGVYIWKITIMAW